jgi:hypothetical protein
MKTRLVKLLIFLLFSGTIYGQDQSLASPFAHSKLYTSTGKLIVDSSLSISNQQLVEWLMVEDTLAKLVLKYLKYPVMELDNGIQGKVIISFVLNKDGKIDSLRLERPRRPNSQDRLDLDIRNFSNASFWFLRSASKEFTNIDFHSNLSKGNKYFIPFSFNIDSVEIGKISNGWIFFQKYMDKGIKAMTYCPMPLKTPEPNSASTYKLIKKIQTKCSKNKKQIKQYNKVTLPSHSKTENGEEVDYYYNRGELKIVVVKDFWERGEDYSEYFFEQDTPVFIYNKEYKYNARLTDTLVLDKLKTVVSEDRYYFNNGVLFRWINSDVFSVNSQDEAFREKEKNLLRYVDSLKSEIVKSGLLPTNK